MQHKSQEAYEELLTEVDRQCAAAGYQPQVSVVITDFETAAMNAVRTVFGEDVTTHGCFFHLTQATWRKIQELGHAGTYRTDTEFREFCGMLDGLAFLPEHDVNEGMIFLRSIMPAAAADLVSYFDETYVSGSVRGSRRLVPRFPPSVWNVHAATLTGGDRTNNYSEGWNNHLLHTIGHKHPSIWRLIEALQADAAESSTRIVRHTVGNLSPKKQSKVTKNTQDRLMKLCHEYAAGQRRMDNFIRAVGHSIRFVCIESASS